MGGEEFCVVLPHCPGEAALRTSERLHRVIRALRLPEVPALRVTASMGIATAAPPIAREAFEQQAQALVARADAALYQAKRDGRDRTVVSG